MSGNEQLNRLKARRRGHRGVVTKVLREATSLMIGELTTVIKDRLKTICELLQEKTRVLKELDDEILNISPTEDIEQEIILADEFVDKISKTLKGITLHLKRPVAVNNSSNSDVTPDATADATDGDESAQQPSSDHESTLTPGNLASSLRGQGKGMPKLPKLIIPKFSGEIAKFRSFWDSFDSAIHKNITLQSIQRIYRVYREYYRGTSTSGSFDYWRCVGS